MCMKVNFKLEQATKAQSGRTGIALLFLFFNLGARWGWVVNATPRPIYPLRKRPGTHCIGDWVNPRAVWTGAEILSPPGPSSPESLYRLRYPSPIHMYVYSIGFVYHM